MISSNRDITDYFVNGIIRDINDKGLVSRVGLEKATNVIITNKELSTNVVENKDVLSSIMLDSDSTFVFKTSIGTIICSEDSISFYNPKTLLLTTLEATDNSGIQIDIEVSHAWKAIDCFGYVILSSETQHFKIENNTAVRYDVQDITISLVGERLFVNTASQEIFESLKSIYNFKADTDISSVVWIGEPGYSDSIIKVFENVNNAISPDNVFSTTGYESYRHFLTNKMRDNLISNFVVPTNDIITSIVNIKETILVSTFNNTYQFSIDNVNNNLVISYISKLYFGVVNNFVSYTRDNELAIIDSNSNLYYFTSEGLTIKNLQLPAIYSLNSHFNRKHNLIFLSYDDGTICLQPGTGITTTLSYRYLNYDHETLTEYVTSFKEGFAIKSNWIYPILVSNPMTIKSIMINASVNENVTLALYANNRKRTYSTKEVIVNSDGAVHNAIYGSTFSLEITGLEINMTGVLIEFQVDNRHYKRSRDAS